MKIEQRIDEVCLTWLGQPFNILSFINLGTCDIY